MDARFITVGVTISFDYPMPHLESVASEEARNSSYESHAYRVDSPRPQFCDLVHLSGWTGPDSNAEKARWVQSPSIRPQALKARRV